MKKDITIVTSLVGAGLEREYLLLRELLMSHGHYVMGVHYTDLQCPLHPSDIMISFEVVSPRTLSLSRENWLVPNSEWWSAANDQFLPKFTRILCKTRDCYNIWCAKVGAEKCVYTSFESRDIYQPETTRVLRCLHVAGKSEYKNTDAVLRAWRMTNSPLPPLTVIARAPCFDPQFDIRSPFPNSVNHIAHATDEQIIHFMNSHQIHVMPSMYEGFGHVIHEALGCGGLVVTTDAPPMNEYNGILRECLVPVGSRTPHSLAHFNMVVPTRVQEAVLKAVPLTQSPLFEERSKTAREAFLANREFFRKTIMELVNG